MKREEQLSATDVVAAAKSGVRKILLHHSPDSDGIVCTLVFCQLAKCRVDELILQFVASGHPATDVPEGFIPLDMYCGFKGRKTSASEELWFHLPDGFVKDELHHLARYATQVDHNSIGKQAPHLERSQLRNVINLMHASGLYTDQQIVGVGGALLEGIREMAAQSEVARTQVEQALYEITPHGPVLTPRRGHVYAVTRRQVLRQAGRGDVAFVVCDSPIGVSVVRMASKIHLGELMNDRLRKELSETGFQSCYAHEDGLLLGWGTKKSPNPAPPIRGVKLSQLLVEELHRYRSPS